MIQSVQLSRLHASPFNPRPDLGDLSELTDSIREVGVLQPPLARPNADDGFELVFGHRRKAAAAAAGLTEIAVDVRELDDREVLLAQLAENAHRCDVHPVHEAEHLRRLHEEHQVPVDELAAKVGKSKGYVYARLKLCSLSKAARKAALKGELSAAIALMVARIPAAKLQNAALEQLKKGRWGEPYTTENARRLIRDEYMLRLADADFDITDAELVPVAGACTTCPHRTGAQPELFTDVDSPDLCTNPPCFDSKREVSWKRRSAEARAKGLRVLTAKETKEVLGGPSWKEPEGHVDLDQRAPYTVDPKSRTWRRLLGARAVKGEVVLARDEDGHVRELFDKKRARELLKEKRPELTKARASSSGISDSERKQREEAKAHRHAAEAALGEVVDAVEKGGAIEVAALADYWRLVVGELLEGGWSDVVRVVAKRRGLDVPKQQRAEEVLQAELKTMTAAQLAALLLELICTRRLYSSWVRDKDARLKAACELLGVDWAKHKREGKKATAPARRKKKAPAKPKAGKKANATKSSRGHPRAANDAGTVKTTSTEVRSRKAKRKAATS